MEIIYILKVRPNYHGELFRLERPQQYFSTREGRMRDVKPKLPSLCWGFGHTPFFKDRSYSMLAVGWGPLIQLVVTNDLKVRD